MQIQSRGNDVSMIQTSVASSLTDRLQQTGLLLIVSIPSLYIFLTLPPLWRDEDAFNEIASTFAPRGIIHYLPGYCLGGRLIVFAGSIVASLLGGHGLPRLSISATPLTDTGICTLIVVQHLFLILSLFYAVRTFSDRYPVRVLVAVIFACTPWPYIYANCIGSEGFSNPLVYLVAAFGWNCLRKSELSRRRIIFYFCLLLASALTRHINALLVTCLPIALLPLAAKEVILRGTILHRKNGPSRFRYTRRFMIFLTVGLLAIGTSLLAQQTLCWLFRVPFRSTFGETFEYRLSYLGRLPEQERAVILFQISRKLGDPVVTEALQALNRSLSHGENWANMFLYYKIDEILVRSGYHETQSRTWQTDLKLNEIAMFVLLSGEPNFQNAVWNDFVLSPFFTQPNLAYPPFELTDWVQSQLRYSRYQQLKDLVSFQHQAGYYQTAWARIRYAHLFERIPLLEMACLTFTFAFVFIGLALLGVFWEPMAEAGVSYAVGLTIVGFLVSFATCLSTYFQGRLYLPVYALFQMGMLLTISLAAQAIWEKLQILRKHDENKVTTTCT